MKFFATIFAVVMGAAAVSANVAAPQDVKRFTCIDLGNTCKADGSFGNCCSGFCLQEKGALVGICK